MSSFVLVISVSSTDSRENNIIRVQECGFDVREICNVPSEIGVSLYVDASFFRVE